MPSNQKFCGNAGKCFPTSAPPSSRPPSTPSSSKQPSTHKTSSDNTTTIIVVVVIVVVVIIILVVVGVYRYRRRIIKRYGAHTKPAKNPDVTFINNNTKKDGDKDKRSVGEGVWFWSCYYPVETKNLKVCAFSFYLI